MFPISRYKQTRIPKGQSKMENPEKLATYNTQDEENKKHNRKCFGNYDYYIQTNTNNVNKTCVLLQCAIYMYVLLKFIVPKYCI